MKYLIKYLQTLQYLQPPHDFDIRFRDLEYHEDRKNHDDLQGLEDLQEMRIGTVVKALKIRQVLKLLHTDLRVLGD
jgi:hypothetical protein